MARQDVQISYIGREKKDFNCPFSPQCPIAKERIRLEDGNKELLKKNAELENNLNNFIEKSESELGLEDRELLFKQALQDSKIMQLLRRNKDLEEREIRNNEKLVMMEMEVKNAKEEKNALKNEWDSNMEIQKLMVEIRKLEAVRNDIKNDIAKGENIINNLSDRIRKHEEDVNKVINVHNNWVEKVEERRHEYYLLGNQLGVLNKKEIEMNKQQKKDEWKKEVDGFFNLDGK